jgi:serine/threonine kinase 16
MAVKLSSHADIAKAKDDVERFSTPAYRAPELFRVSSCVSGQSLHYGTADVWSLGCLLFAMLYGLSPFEMEWRISLVQGAEADGTAVWVGATFDKVLGPIPFPSSGCAAANRYKDKLKGLLEWMLDKAGSKRPSTGDILERVDSLL